MQVEVYTLVGTDGTKEARMYAKLQKLAPSLGTLGADPNFARSILEAIRNGALYVGIEDGATVVAVFLSNTTNAFLQILLFDDTRNNIEFLKAACDNALARFSLNKIKTECLTFSELLNQLAKSSFSIVGICRRETLIGDEWKDTVLLERLQGEPEAPAEEEDEEEIVETLQTFATPSPSPAPQPEAPKPPSVKSGHGMDGDDGIVKSFFQAPQPPQIEG